MPGGRELIAFAEDIVSGGDTLPTSRATVAATLSPAAMVDAAGVASNFERMVRIADATGIELDARMDELAGEIHSALDLKRPVGR